MRCAAHLQREGFNLAIFNPDGIGRSDLRGLVPDAHRGRVTEEAVALFTSVAILNGRCLAAATPPYSQKAA